MSGARMSMLKKAVNRTTRQLRSTDSIGVVAFDTSPFVAFGLQPVGKGKAVRRAVANLTTGGGTAVAPALQKGYALFGKTLRRSKRVRRHVVLVSDGYSPYGKALVAARARAKVGVTTSAIGLGGSADRKLLMGIARIGKGRYYQVDNPGDLTVVLLKELRRLGR
jgi:Mg-chelatase subunit ChlD